MLKIKHKFGSRSKAELNTCHKDLILIHETTIAICNIDYGIHQGKRSDEEQLEYFLSGKSSLDPRVPSQRDKSKHLRTPSEATDFHVAEKHEGNSLAWDSEQLIYVAASLVTVSKMLYNAGKVEHIIRWGGNWDMDGVIIKDQKFDDLVHVELYKP